MSAAGLAAAAPGPAPRRPNVLVLMADQVNGTLFPDGPAPFLRTPHLSALAERSTRFSDAYTPSPLCAPGRSAFMTGQLPSQTGVYDNGAELASAVPTFAHHLRRLGYQTCLSGKMHFVGPDQLHGFEQRLTTDVYPADFGWTPDWARPDQRIPWWFHTLASVTGAGTAEITNQLEYDDEVSFHAEQKLYDLARARDPRPWCLTVSFSHPHDPYVARRRFWDLYDDVGELDPRTPAVPVEALDPHSRRLLRSFDAERFDITPEHVRRARRGYLASLSYVDDRVGSLLDVLERCGMTQDTLVLVTSDHGDMLGERGLWFKMSFAEGSARVPLMLALPPSWTGGGAEPGLVRTPVSLLDVLPTLVEVAGGDPGDPGDTDPRVGGTSLLRTAEGADRGPVPLEYMAEGSAAPMVALRDGRWKVTACPLDPPQLFDTDRDPDELDDLAGDPAHADRLAGLLAQLGRRWDLPQVDADVRRSQAARHLVYQALRSGTHFPWDHQPLRAASERYMRNHLDLNVLEEAQRFPRQASD